ncbi:putative family 1 glycoside hydrolase [Klebsiella pneumoniae]|uniref:Putative family 1 glycoside hydrolase n=1 Tax=Klebsiella pneumoniae TaxID=573 RepID=A0A378AGR4_KLEPN|nr:putative family 1 glycoside hydrolase [Klebsiella pneumoniae]
MMAHVHLTHYLHQTKPQCQMGGMLAHALVYPATCNHAISSAPSSWIEFLKPEPAARLRG